MEQLGFLISLHLFVNRSITQIYPLYTLDPRDEKTIWMKQGSNPGPQASQATALSITPWLTGPEEWSI